MDTGKVVRASNVQAVGWRVWTVEDRPEGLRLGSVIARISRAAIWMSAGEPRKPPEPWWIITFAFGST